MKAKKIYEVLDFKQGENPYRTMRVGGYRDIEIGDKFEITIDLYALPGREWTNDIFRKIPGHIVLHEGEIIEIWKPDEHMSNAWLVNIASDDGDYTSISIETFKNHPDWFKRL